MHELQASENSGFVTLDIARAAALKAGKFLNMKLGNVRKLQRKSRYDYLLDADLDAEKIIVTELRDSFPTYDILSEETKVESFHSTHCWVVDPLDGSFNFQHGNPAFGISISLLINKVTTVSVIYLPRLDEMFTAVLGSGAQLNGHSIHVSSTMDLEDASIHVGDFSKDGNHLDNLERLNDIAHLANSVGRVRMIGTAATDLAYIACGRADALVVHNALPWDIEVGCLLVTEAGGAFSRFEDEGGNSLAVCSNTHIHQALIDVINEDVSPQIRQQRKLRIPF